MNKIDTIKDAIAEVDKHVNVKESEPVHGGRHRLLRTSGGKYWLIFKRDFFKTYGKQFEGEEGVGESINVEAKDQAVKRGVDDLLFCYPDGKIYAIGVKEAYIYSVRNDTVRRTSQSEYTLSFPVNEMYSWVSEQEKSQVSLKEVG